MIKAEFQKLLRGIESDLYCVIRKLDRLDNLVNPYLRLEDVEERDVRKSVKTFISDYADLEEAVRHGISFISDYTAVPIDEEESNAMGELLEEETEAFNDLLDMVNKIENQSATRARKIIEKTGGTTKFQGILRGMQMPNGAPIPARAYVILTNEGLPQKDKGFVVEVIMNDEQYKATNKVLGHGGNVRVTFNGVLSYDEDGVCVKDARDWELEFEDNSNDGLEAK